MTALLDLLTWLRPERRKAMLNEALRSTRVDIPASAIEQDAYDIYDSIFNEEGTLESVQAAAARAQAQTPTEVPLTFAYDDETRAVSEFDTDHASSIRDPEKLKAGRSKVVDLVMDEYTGIRQKGFRRARGSSIGDGVKEANYWLKDYAMGNTPYSQMPTNPAMNQWFPPSYLLALDAPRQSAHYVTERLLGTMRYHRLNPPLMELPTVVATMMTRFWPWHEVIVQAIDKEVDSEVSKRAIQATVDYVENDWLSLGPVKK